MRSLCWFPAGEHYLGSSAVHNDLPACAGEPVAAVDSVLTATANPQNPSEGDVSQPSSALVRGRMLRETRCTATIPTSNCASPRTSRRRGTDAGASGMMLPDASPTSHEMARQAPPPPDHRDRRTDRDPLVVVRHTGRMWPGSSSMPSTRWLTGHGPSTSWSLP